MTIISEAKESSSSGGGGGGGTTTTLLDLPPELILEIFRFIDFRTLFNTVILTCRRFYDILCADNIWKTLFAMRWKEDDIVNNLYYINDSKDVCFTYDDIDVYWKGQSNVATNTDTSSRVVSCRMDKHFAPVDDVHIMPSGDICVSGSRDRTAVVWDLSDFVGDSSWNGDGTSPTPTTEETLKGHTGWVWSVDSDVNRPNVVITSSWDQTVKEWDLNHSLHYTENHHYHPAAILSLSCHDNVFTTACCDKIVRTYDPRSKSVVVKSRHHRKAVLCVQVTDKYILSGSDDQTIGVYDVRAGKLMTSLQVDSPVLCMNLAGSQGFNYLRAGGRNGNLYIFDTSHDRFTLLDSMQLWQNGYMVNKLCNYKGALAACSQGGAVCMYSPDRSVRFLKKFHQHSADVAGAHARKNLLVTGSGDNSVIAWKFNT